MRILIRYTHAILLLLLTSQVIAQQSSAEWTKLMEEAKQKKQSDRDNLPQKNISKHVAAIASPDKAVLLKISSTVHAKAKEALDKTMLSDLDEFLKKESSEQAIVSEAMMLYTAGVRINAPLYLLASIIQKNQDPWYINNLGVLLKSDEQYEKAFQCFLYADKNLKVPSAIVKTNLGWTAAYYGDFEAAKKYFNEALKLAPLHDGALEGLSSLAYSEGDYKALIELLVKRMKMSMNGGISQMTAPGLIDDVLDNYEKNPELRKADPLENHLFDNNNPEDNRRNPGGATDIIPRLPAITAYFSYDAFHLAESMDEIRDVKKEIYVARDKEIEALAKEFKSLPPWKRDPYYDETGDLIIPYNYEQEFKMFERVTVELNKRDIWLSKKMIKEELAFQKSIQAGPQLERMTRACAGKNNDCSCTWAKQNLGVVNSDLSGYFGFWSKCYKQWLDNVNWYIAASSVFIKRVHHPQLNDWLNWKRQAVVSNYILSKYITWLDDCLRVGGEVAMLNITKECADNPPKTSMAASEELINPPLKKLKTWPEPCHVPTGDFDSKYSPGGLVMTCTEMHVRFGLGKFGNFRADFKFGENEKQDEVKIYLQGKLEAGLSKSVSIDGKKIGEAGVNAELSGDAFIQFKGNKVNYGIEGNAEATASLGAKAEEDGMSGAEKAIAKRMDKYMPNGEVKGSGEFMWTAETGAKTKWNGVETKAGGLLDSFK